MQILLHGPLVLIANDGSELRQHQDCCYVPRHSQNQGSSGRGSGSTRHDYPWVIGMRMQRTALYTLGMYDELVAFLRANTIRKPRRKVLVRRLVSRERSEFSGRGESEDAGVGSQSEGA